ncbi:MAG: hypothetical protein R6U27_01740 [Desulfobacterales bacterium]
MKWSSQNFWIRSGGLKAGFGSVYHPFALERKYKIAERSWAWQYTFPATKRSVDRRTRIERRHHVAETIRRYAMELTPRQRSFYDFLVSHHRQYGFSPTVREICKKLGLAGPAGVHRILGVLEENC